MKQICTTCYGSGITPGMRPDDDAEPCDAPNCADGAAIRHTLRINRIATRLATSHGKTHNAPAEGTPPSTPSAGATPSEAA